jgi:ribonucleoside-diphosphate reductase alpha chain
MNRLGRFWKDPAKSSAYRKAKAEEMKSRKPAVLQAIAARVKMLNVGYELLNAGHDLSTFDSYITAREAVGRRVPSVPGQREKFVRQFGSYEGFLAALAAENHRVVEVRPIGLMGVVSVEVDDPEPDDKRDWSEHNYILSPIGGDSPFMSGVAVLNTRRAAKMQTLKVTHPDIVDFIQCKAKEDRKARALVAAGWPNTMSGHPDEAYSSVLFQNSNLSVRATDEFMDRALVTNGADWTTWGVHERLQSFSTGMPAKVILDMIAECALECGDPGMQFEDTIQRWHTCPNSGPINSSNPCTEFMFLDDTACNLASINVVRFWDGSQFDVAGFRHAVRATIIAQETLVDHGSYPTEEIAANSHRFRPLGLGLANIGGLLMRMGIPYDSDLGRSWAAALSSLMTAVGYETSAGIAEVRGPFDEYAENRDPMMKVIRQHVHAASVGRNAAPDRTPLTEVWTSATQAWDRATLAGSRFGYRNAQISLYAPTGTIAFMMDCDTTGIEPAVALVSDKSLAGGGVLRMECPAVGPALERLGYSSDRAFDILQGLNRTGTLKDLVRDEHLPVFDTAMPDASGRSLSWEAHVKMIAAVQPHVSGAISKTINMPSTSTAKDVRDAYVEAWRLGIKALAIYVDGSKGVQPVNAVVPEAAPATEDAPVDLRAASVNTRPDPYRERLPDTRESVTHKFTVGAHEGYVTVGFFPGTRRPGELFVKMAKEGSTIGGLMDSVGTLASINLQYGVPLEVLVRKFAHASFEPAGPTQYPDLPFARSVVDYVFRWLGMEFLPGYREANAPRRGGDEDRPGPRDPGPRDPDGAAVREVEGPRSGPVATAQSENPTCDVCGALTFRCGTCYRCFNCGNSLGCS